MSKKHHLAVSGFAALLLAATLGVAQETNPTATGQSPLQSTSTTMTQQDNGNSPDSVPLYKIQVVAREIPAINYFHRHGATKIGFEGTTLLPGAKGKAEVEAKLGRTVIDANFQGITPANGYGPEYLTYVLWAITPEGRPVNLGEVLPSGRDKTSLTVTTNLQAFGLIITAEPYYAVTTPSDVVVMQNRVDDQTQGVIEQVNAKYSLLPRGAYAETAGRHSVLHPITRDERSPLELYEAQNAVQIAEAAGAEKYALDTLTTARTALKNAEDIDRGKNRNRKETITFAREAVQSSEDARIITIRKIKAEDDAAALKARQDAEEAARQSQQAAEEQAAARAKADEARAKADADRAEAEAQAAKARADREAAEAARKQAEQSAQAAAAQAEQVRERLRQQLNQVLQTTESARGLIVNMSDVLFDFNKYTLKPEAREKLAKVSGILLAYPSLKLQVEGYTDNIGSDEYNQKLSEQRADSVRTYLVTQSVADANVSAKGFGKTNPIADNSTNQGRAQNRRVELVVSGAAIGIATDQQGEVSAPPPPTGSTAAPQSPANENNLTGTSNPPQ